MPPRHQEALPAHWGSWTGCLSDAGSPPSLPPPASPGLERDKFDNKTVSFEEHIKFEHNMWNYLYFIVLVRVKNKTDYTGPESYVAQMIKVRAWGATGGGTAVDPCSEAAGAGELELDPLEPPTQLCCRGGLWKKPPEDAGGVWGPWMPGVRRPCLWGLLCGPF